MQRDREELFLVTGGSAAQHRKDLSSIGYGVGTVRYLGGTLSSKIAMSARWQGRDGGDMGNPDSGSARAIRSCLKDRPGPSGAANRLNEGRVELSQ